MKRPAGLISLLYDGQMVSFARHAKQQKDALSQVEKYLNAINVSIRLPSLQVPCFIKLRSLLQNGFGLFFHDKLKKRCFDALFATAIKN